MKPNIRTAFRMDLTEFVPFGAALVIVWFFMISIFLTMDISEPFIWYSMFYGSFLVTTELAYGSNSFSVPRGITNLTTIGFVVWIGAFVGYMIGVL